MKSNISREFEVFKNVIIKQTGASLDEPLLKAVASGIDEFGGWLDRAAAGLEERVKGLRDENETLRSLVGIGEADVRAKILEQAAELNFLRDQLLALKADLSASGKANDALRLELEQFRQELGRIRELREKENGKNSGELSKLLEKLDALEAKISKQQGEIEEEKKKLSADNSAALEQARRAVEARAREEIRLLGTRLRNLGNPISGSAKFCLEKIEGMRNLSKKGKNCEEALELAPDLDLIMRNGQEITQVLDSYMKLYEDVKPDLENVDFAKVWDSVNVKFANQFVRSGVKVRMPQEKKYPPFVTDAKVLQEIVDALAVNALESLPKGGKLLISGEFSAENAKLVFADDGPGVKPDNAQKLFLPFFTTKPGHWGMGLARSLKLAKTLGGSLEYAPPSGGTGCEFTLTLPSLKGKK